MMVPIQPMNDEGSIQLSTLKQIIQQRKKNYNSTFLRFVWCKNSRSFFRQKSQLLTHKSFLFYSWNVVERLHSFEQIHLGTTTYLVNRHLHHSFIKKKIFRFRFLCACSLNGGNYLNYSLQRSRTQYILVIFGGRTIFLYRCFFSWIQTCSGYNWILEMNRKVAKAFNTCPQLMTTTQDFTPNFSSDLKRWRLIDEVLLQIQIAKFLN